MEGKILAISFLVILIFCFIAVFKSIQYFSKVLSEIDPKKGLPANLLPWMVPFSPWFLTENGKLYQSKFIKHLAISMICFALLSIISNI